MLNTTNPNPENLMSINSDSFIAKTQIAIFKFSSLDSTLDISTLKFNWTITGFTDQQYLNGRYSSSLKINVTDIYTPSVLVSINVTMNSNTYIISLNYSIPTPPTMGTCIVNPFKGVFLVTNFNFTVSNFISANTPLSYKYYYINLNGDYVPFSGDYMLSKTYSSSVVPLSNTYYAEAIDSLGLITSTLCPIVVSSSASKTISGDQIQTALNSIGDPGEKLTVSKLYNLRLYL